MRPLITPHIHLVDTQHSFWVGHSTTAAHLPLAHQIASGFNQNCPLRRTVAMALDFSKAMDTVNHTALIRSLLNSTMDPNTVRWLCTYHSVLSPTLSNAYASDYPTLPAYVLRMWTISLCVPPIQM